ncbi:hypothetical protein [Mucilaginibacter sp.]|jgi:hypothetical protein|uniref:hypothetical protein n=1 Tax=Mucilaginibacter sp. TaxID=1882438 RepID=UPI00261EBF18|nr:hypothetical protein [Mucilaginibacter sp.]MDB5126886.1 hypothetical protein [Mucilaginibacter sp.]
MKLKLLLLILSFSVILFSCKKEKSPEDKLDDAKNQVIGTWAGQNSSATYYDASGKVVKTEHLSINDNLQIQFLNTTTLKGSDRPDDPYNYTISNVDGKLRLNVSGESYELKVNNNTMSWIIETEINIDTIVKSVTTIQFKKI